MTERKKFPALWIGTLFLLIIFDQITKYLAGTGLPRGACVPLIPGVFDLFYLENTGAAFGMFDNMQWFFIFIALVMIAAAVYVYSRMPAEPHYNPLRIVCALIAAGAAGNMIDRIIHHYVIDFLYFSLIDFPVFNVADCYVCIGTALTVILIFTVYRDESFDFLFHTK